MYRSFNGITFEGKHRPGTFVVTLHDLGNGHREASIRPRIDWTECDPLDPWVKLSIERAHAEKTIAQREAEERERVLRQKKRSAQRAKTRARRVCKALGLDTLLTLTYRANQTDLAVCKRHFELLAKRLNYLLGRFLFVAAFERQERGAWHVHIATRRIAPDYRMRGVKVKSYDAIRAVWRAVVGELGGNVDVSGKPARNGKKVITSRSPARVAAYVSKYLTKDFEDWPDGLRRLQTSPCKLPDPTRVELIAARMAELVELVYAFTADGACDIVTTRVGPFGDTFYMATERPQARWGGGGQV